MQTTRRDALRFMGSTVFMGGAGLATGAQAQLANSDFRFGKLFTSTNDVTGNELLVFGHQGPLGTLGLLARLPTQGLGTGISSGVQGSVTLSRDGRYLYVVNTLSETVSTFAVQPQGLLLTSTVPSGDSRPLGVAEYNGFVYVLNEGYWGSMTCFRNVGGTLQPLPLSYRQLSSSGPTSPGQVGFSPDGRVLFVTLRAVNTVLSYHVGSDGVTDALLEAPSAGGTPFGFAFDQRCNAVVAQASRNKARAGTLSAYEFAGPNQTTPVVLNGAIKSRQTGTCCVAISPDGRFAFAVNTVSNTVSRYAIAPTGQLSLLTAVAASTENAPIEAVISPTERKLLVLNSGSLTISAFDIGSDGALSSPVSTGGLPVGVSGLAAN